MTSAKGSEVDVNVPVRWGRTLACAWAAVAILAMTGVGARAQQLCPDEGELAALDARALQTELMVAALSCSQNSRYNQFVQTFRVALVERGKVLSGLFNRTYGPDGEEHLNRFVTRLANEASQEALAAGPAYCSGALPLFEELLATSPDDFDRFTRQPWIRVRHGVRPCVANAAER
jgi:hypothetical protein